MVHPSRCGQIAAVVVLALLSMCAGTHAQVFSSPKNVSNNADFELTPQVAVDAAGNINMVWEDDTANNSNILFSRSTDGGATFSTPTNLSNTAGYSSNPRICVDSHGAVNVVWEDDSLGNLDVFFSRSTDGGVTFSTPLNLSNDPASSASPQIAVDSSGNISVVWENDTLPNGILFTHSGDGGATFSAPLNLATNPSGSFAPQIAIGADGGINVVWEDDFNFHSDISFSRSVDQGATFTAPQNLSNNPGNSSEAQIAVDVNGNINVVWTDDTPGNFDILFTRSADKGATFSSAQNVSNSPGDSGSPQVAADANGNIYVSWQDNLPPSFSRDIFLARSNDGGISFLAPQNLSNNPGNSINQWITVDAAGGVNLAWQDNTPGKANIFFTRSVDAGATFATQNLSNDSGSSSDVQIVAEANGNLDVVWSDDAPGVNQIFFSHFGNPVTQNQPPVANAGADQTLPAAGPSGTSVTLNGSLSSDPDGDALTFVWSEGSTVVGKSAIVVLTATMGVHTYTLTVTDAGGLSSSAVTHVTITNQPPVANAGADQTLPAAGPGTSVTLNGSLSSDPDGDALTFVWNEGGTVVGKSAIVVLTATMGVHTYTLTVTDAGGLSSSAVTHVTITNRPPVANAGADQTLPAAGPGTSVTLNGSLSSDPDGDALAFVWNEGSTVVGKSAIVVLTATMGVHTYTLTVTDAGGLSSSAVTHVTITNRPPVANAGADPIFQCAGPGGTLVKLDGLASADPNGYALKFVWADSSGNVVGNSAVTSVLASPGTHIYTLTVTDAAGLSSTALTSVTVRDTTPPMLHMTLSPTLLFPANHKLVQIAARIQASDVCDANVTVQLVSITFNGTGNGEVQAVGGGPVRFGTDVRSFLLRADRSANGANRVYTVTYRAKDASGNATLASATVTVGKDSNWYGDGPRSRDSNGNRIGRGEGSRDRD